MFWLFCLNNSWWSIRIFRLNIWKMVVSGKISASCSTYCRAQRASWPNWSSALHALYRTCSRALRASFPTCSCVSHSLCLACSCASCLCVLVFLSHVSCALCALMLYESFSLRPLSRASSSLCANVTFCALEFPKISPSNGAL